MKGHVTKNLLAGQKMDFRAFFVRITRDGQRLNTIAIAKFHFVFFTIAIHREFEPVRQCVDHRDTHAV